MTAEAPVAEAAQKRNPLDEIVVRKPEASNEHRRKWLCGIKAIDGLEHLDLQIRIGPAVFARQTFLWEGQGDDAKQVFMKGAINVLTDKQVEEIKAKAKFRYIRRTYNKGVLVGIADIDASDSGGIKINKDTGEHEIRPPIELPGKTVQGDVPLKDILTMDVAYEDSKVRGRVVTLEEAKRIVAEAEAEVNRPLESIDATFESGHGGKAVKEDPKVNATLESLARSRPSVAGAPAIESESFGGSRRVAGNKSVTGGAGRLPEGK